MMAYLNLGGNLGTNIDTSASSNLSLWPPRPYFSSKASSRVGILAVEKKKNVRKRLEMN